MHLDDSELADAQDLIERRSGSESYSTRQITKNACGLFSAAEAGPRGRLAGSQMKTITIRVDSSTLDNPDSDIRYHLPDLLAQRSGGVISDDGYDYVGDKPFLVIFVKSSSLDPKLACILDVIENVRVMGNDLR